VSEVHCKSVLNRSGIPVVDYAVNPYVGCAHACVYCYAIFMRRFTGHTGPWGSFVDVKLNAPDVLARQMTRARPGRITVGTVTDPYQPAERSYGITRGCLEVLRGHDSPVSILTKSDLVLRDRDILRTMRDVSVGLTVTTLDEQARARFEPHAPPAEARLTALRELSASGIATWAFCGPLLPFISDSANQTDRLFAAVAEAGAASVVVDSMKLRGPIWARVRRVVERHYPDLTQHYRRIAAHRRPYHDALLARARESASRHGLEVRV
jgi:DNA repair photolyase